LCHDALGNYHRDGRASKTASVLTSWHAEFTVEAICSNE
jgi:hypothetical protein